MSLSNESLTANLTFIVSLAFVALQMHVQISFFSEMITTNVTLERFDSQMLSKMNLKSRLLRVRDRADMAFERFLITMVYHVCLQMTFSYEGETALRE